MNPSGRRRTEVRQDAGPTVAQFMVLAWMDVGTRRCATPQGGFLECPDAQHIANRINQSPAWRSRPISLGRVKAMLQEFTRCGYLTGKQLKHRDEHGNWRSAPALRTFTRQFFLELGGPRLWEQLRTEGKQKIKRWRAAALQAGVTLKDFLNPGEILKPAAARLAKLSRRMRKPIERRHRVDPAAVRVGETYRKAWVNTVESLWMRHSEHAPPREKWSMVEIKDNATRITDKQFGLI